MGTNASAVWMLLPISGIFWAALELELELEVEVELEGMLFLVLPLCLVVGGEALKLMHRG